MASEYEAFLDSGRYFFPRSDCLQASKIEGGQETVRTPLRVFFSEYSGKEKSLPVHRNDGQ